VATNIPYLYEAPAGAYKVRGQSGNLKIDKHFTGKNARSAAVQAANLFKKKVDNLTKGFITRAELAEQLGIKASALEAAKGKNSRLWQQIKNLMEIKQAGRTSPEFYKFKKNPAETINTLKKFSGLGGKGLERDLYKGKESVIGKVRKILTESKIPLNIKDIEEKLTGKRPSGRYGYDATIKNSVSMLKHKKEFKNKIVSISQEEMTEGVVKAKALKRTPYIKSVRDVFVQDPDAGIGDVAEGLFGTEKYKNASKLAKVDMEKEASRSVIKFLQAISGKGSSTAIKGFKDISPDKLGDILESIESRVTEFGFEPGSRRKLQWAIADASRGLSPGRSLALIKKLRQKGFHIDEVIPMASVFREAPGYIEATQKIPNYINTIKGTTLDSHFGKTFKNVLKGDFSGVEGFNEKSRAFAKKYNIDTPIIRTGEGLNPKNFVKNFDKYTKAGQKNITQLAKEKGFVIETKSKPLTELVENFITKVKSVPGGCRSVITRALGGKLDTCEAIIKADPERAAVKLNNAITATKGPLKNLKDDSQKLIRLFRGESLFKPKDLGYTGDKIIPQSARGRWFSKSPEVAGMFADYPGIIKKVDVTPAEFEKGKKIQTKTKLGSYVDPNELILPKSKMTDVGIDIPRTIGYNLKWDNIKGAFVNTATDDVASQAELKTWAADNPMNVKVGEAAPGILRKTGKALAHIGLPLPTAAMDAYFIGREIEEGKSPEEIARNPLNWLGLATMDPLTKAAGMAEKSGKLSSILRLGMSPGLIRGATRFLGLPGLALSTGLTAYDQYQKYKQKEGFVYNLFNPEEIDNTRV